MFKPIYSYPCFLTLELNPWVLFIVIVGYKGWDLLLPRFSVSNGPPVFTFLLGGPVPLTTAAELSACPALGGQGGHCYSVFSLDYSDRDSTVKGVLGAVQEQAMQS